MSRVSESKTITWQPERNNWSTTEHSEFRSDKREIWSERELQSHVVIVEPGERIGWVTEPVNGLTPDCEPVDGKCACGRGI